MCVAGLWKMAWIRDWEVRLIHEISASARRSALDFFKEKWG